MIDFSRVKLNTSFVTRHKERCTVLDISLHCERQTMPIYKVKFSTSSHEQHEALYYQNGTMFEPTQNCWDIVSYAAPLIIDDRFIVVAPNGKRHRKD